MLRSPLRLPVALFAAAALAACGGDASARSSDDLTRDLELARSAEGIELVPAPSATAVVSEIEQTAAAKPAPSPARARAPKPTARPAPSRATATVPTRQPTAVPRPRPPVFDDNVISPPPPGGYKTVDEVIRNAPFPIKP